MQCRIVSFVEYHARDLAAAQCNELRAELERAKANAAVKWSADDERLCKYEEIMRDVAGELRKDPAEQPLCYLDALAGRLERAAGDAPQTGDASVSASAFPDAASAAPSPAPSAPQEPERCNATWRSTRTITRVCSLKHPHPGTHEALDDRGGLVAHWWDDQGDSSMTPHTPQPETREQPKKRVELGCQAIGQCFCTGRCKRTAEEQEAYEKRERELQGCLSPKPKEQPAPPVEREYWDSATRQHMRDDNTRLEQERDAAREEAERLRATIKFLKENVR